MKFFKDFFLKKAFKSEYYNAYISYPREEYMVLAKDMKSFLKVGNNSNKIYIGAKKPDKKYSKNKLLRRIEKTDNFIVILNNSFFEKPDNENNYQLYEITQAIKTKRNIILVLTSDFDNLENKEWSLYPLYTQKLFLLNLKSISCNFFNQELSFIKIRDSLKSNTSKASAVIIRKEKYDFHVPSFGGSSFAGPSFREHSYAGPSSGGSSFARQPTGGASGGGITFSKRNNNDSPFNNISCTLFSKDSVCVNESLFMQVFVHEYEKTNEALEMAKEFDKDTSRRQTKMLGAEIRLNSLLVFELEIENLNIKDPVQSLRWLGFTDSIQYVVKIPPDYREPNLIGKIKVFLEDIPIGCFSFKINIADSVISTEIKQNEIKKYKYAFISYSSKDRDEVLRRVQMLDLLNIKYFQDFINLKAGDRWSDEIYEQINKADVFLLFWSSAAKNSVWVMREVNYAMKRNKGIAGTPPEIFPVIIEGPPVVEPPELLEHIHFNDKIAYFIQGSNRQ